MNEATITMQTYKNPCRVHLGLHGKSTKGSLKEPILFRVYGSKVIRNIFTRSAGSTFTRQNQTSSDDRY